LDNKNNFYIFILTRKNVEKSLNYNIGNPDLSGGVET
jgi:hypothetical protein